jgi:predicted nuclease of predicted toxin-antitoxin system
VKLLFDQNISFRAVKQIARQFPQARQVRELQLENFSDKRIWEFAKEQNYTIVTFDADFYDLVTLYGHPPKVIWLRLGNTTNQNLIIAFENHAEIIKEFVEDQNYKDIGCLEIDA